MSAKKYEHVPRDEQPSVRVTAAVIADDITNACAEKIGKVVVCLLNFWQKVVTVVMEVIHPDNDKDVTLPQSGFRRVVELSKHICKDYIYHKLSEKDMHKKLNFGGYNSILSEHFIFAGHVLEKMYPKVYCDVSRKIGRTMSTPGIVKATLNDVLNILFKDAITWGKVVSMFAIAGAFSEECVQQGHAVYVADVVDTVGGFVAMHLVDWIVKHGGWKGLEHAFKEDKDGMNNSVVIGIVGALIGVITVTLTFAIDLG